MIVMTEGTGLATNIGSGLAPLLSTDVYFVPINISTLV